jgi:hypothetical protein
MTIADFGTFVTLERSLTYDAGDPGYAVGNRSKKVQQMLLGFRLGNQEGRREILQVVRPPID